MPGYIGLIGETNNSLNVNWNTQNRINDEIRANNVYIRRNTNNKFLNDKIFINGSDYLVLIEGVILNSADLIEKYKCKDLYETIVTMYGKKGDMFFNDFRGSFSGVFIDKENDKKLIFTDHIGDKQVFYSESKDKFVFSSDLDYMISYFKNNQIKYSLSEEAAYNLLIYGFMLEDNTLVREVKKLMPGHYILINNNKWGVNEYYRLDNETNFDTKDTMIEKIDMLFRQAVTRAFNKDLEYNYKHLVGLSGGLDSRMTTWVANDLGYGDNIVNFTFSQSDYLDETIPKIIASDLHHEWIFKSLDNGLFLKNIYEVVSINCGGALYYGLAHSKSCLDLIDTSKFGIVHTGQLGDVVVGTFYSSLDKNKKYKLSDGAYSTLLLNQNININVKKEYKNEEIFKFYNRGFTGANQGLLVAQEFSETFSPFYDVDFMNYCLSIPVEYRFNHKIYKEWIMNKYPNAARYKWEKINARIDEAAVKLKGKTIPIRLIPKELIDYALIKTKIRKPKSYTKHHMNPLDYWYETNHNLKKYLDNIFTKNIELLENIGEMRNFCELMYSKGSNIEKNQVLTLLVAVELYFGDEK